MKYQAFEIIADDQGCIVYRPKLNVLTHGVAATVLLQQICYWYKKNHYKPFYKFKEPCCHVLYKSDDSWIEELGFTRYEFDSALEKVGIRLNKKNRNNRPEALVYYWTTTDRVTYYEVNLKYFDQEVRKLYLSDNRSNDHENQLIQPASGGQSCDRKGEFPLYVNPESSFTKSGNSALPVELESNFTKSDFSALEDTEITSENKTTSEKQKNTFLYSSKDKDMIKNKEKLLDQNQEIIFSNQFFKVTVNDHTIYQQAYPVVDIHQEYKKMTAWLISQPSVTYKNYKRFINNWLSTAMKAPPIKHKAQSIYPELED